MTTVRRERPPDQHRKARETEPKTKISRLRQEADWTQETLAAKTGIPIRTVQRLEQGEIFNPQIRHLVNIATALGCELEDVAEDEWMRWTAFDQRAAEPPE